MLLHLVTLRFISHVLHQSETRLRSPWRRTLSSSLVILRYKTQSSANSFMDDLMLLARSLMQTKKSKGPKTEPCGTPDLTAQGFEEQLLAVTYWVRLVRKHSIHFRVLGSIFSMLSFSSNWCDTLSKAFAKSKKMQSTSILLSSAEMTSCVKHRSWVSHEWCLRNPCWNLLKNTLVSRNAMRLE